MFKSLQRAYDLRSEGDYDLLPIAREEADSVSEDAAAFVHRIKQHLRARGYDV